MIGIKRNGPALIIGSLIVTTALFALPALGNMPAPQGCGAMNHGGQTSQGGHEGHGGNQQVKWVDAKIVKGVQKVTIRVKGGYSPAAIRVRSGMPVEIAFDCKDKGGCGTTVVFASLKIRQDLEPGKKTIVRFTPEYPGEIAFGCPMDMYKGMVLVQ
jgi:FtsP/CotA-like multicopper oxidase with cupredoxin domain